MKNCEKYAKEIAESLKTVSCVVLEEVMLPSIGKKCDGGAICEFCHEHALDWLLAETDIPEVKNDPVNHPAHYTDGKIEVIEFIEDKKLNFHLGNAVKYISRAGKKEPDKLVQDLRKAIWYLERYIEKVLNG